MTNEDGREMTTGEVIRFYLDHYPNGEGDRQLTIRDAHELTGVPGSTIHRWLSDDVNWDLAVKAKALCAALGIPQEVWDKAILSLNDPTGS